MGRMLLSRAWSLARNTWRHAAGEFSYHRAAGDVADQVTARLEGAVPLGDRICVFVHFDRAGQVWPHTRRYLTALRQAGLDIILVTNSGALQPESEAWVLAHCSRLLLRRNRGYDFGAYRDGIAAMPATPTLLILANDSLYGPLSDLESCLARIDFTAADIWGLTDSWQHRFHLQSFFLAFGPAALAHPAFHPYWAGVRNLGSKWAAVRFYELRMTAAFQAAGLRCAALWDYLSLIDVMQSLAESPEPGANPDLEEQALRRMAKAAVWCADRRIPMNPSSDLWLALLQQGFPFLKRELLRQNPGRVPHLLAWHRRAKQANQDAYGEIVADLQRALRNRTP